MATDNKTSYVVHTIIGDTRDFFSHLHYGHSYKWENKSDISDSMGSYQSGHPLCFDFGLFYIHGERGSISALERPIKNQLIILSLNKFGDYNSTCEKLLQAKIAELKNKNCKLIGYYENSDKDDLLIEEISYMVEDEGIPIKIVELDKFKPSEILDFI